VNEIPSGIDSNVYPLSVSPTEMIGLTDEPGAIGVSIAGVDVWNPELLSPALAGRAASAARVAVMAATAHSLFLITSPLRDV
jgi:hypothetical protein